MPSKKKSSNEGLNAALHQEDALKAVLIADSFDNRCYPVTAKRPRALFPVANKPLLLYTIDFLISCDVKHIYLYCCHCADQIKEYLTQHNTWMKRFSDSVTIIVSSDFHSIGNVLRDVDQKSLFQSDFLLVRGDVVGNIQLKQAVEEHKLRRQKDKKAPLMTLVLRSVPPSNRCRSVENDVVVASDKLTKRVLHYEKLNECQKKVSLPLRIFRSQNNAVEVNYDVTDTGIWVCSPMVPQLFTDNFDYQSQFDFIKGILINEEFLGNQIHMHVCHTKYCGRVYNLHTYDVVSRDVIARWTHPFVPDREFDTIDDDKEIEGGYRLQRNNVYLHTLCTLGNHSKVDKGSIIGRGTLIGDRCQVINSVIGNGCHIDNGCVITGSYIWNDVVIKKNSKVTRSLVCEKVTVHEEVVLEDGCILCDQVAVGPSKTLVSNTIIHLHGKENDDFEESEVKKEGKYDASVIGSKGKGYVWRGRDTDEADASFVDGFWGMSLHKHNQLMEQSRRDRDDVTESDASSLASLEGDDESDESLELDDDWLIFQREVTESLLGGYNEKVQCDNLILEVNSSKYAYNMSLDDVIQAITKSLFELASTVDPSASQYFQTLKKVLLYFAPLLCNYNKTAVAQLQCLYSIEEYATTHQHVADCLVKVLMLLYEKDVLSEDAILHWNSKPKSFNLALLTPEEIRKKVEKFVQWLNEAEEEDSDE